MFLAGEYVYQVKTNKNSEESRTKLSIQIHPRLTQILLMITVAWATDDFHGDYGNNPMVITSDPLKTMAINIYF